MSKCHGGLLERRARHVLGLGADRELAQISVRSILSKLALKEGKRDPESACPLKGYVGHLLYHHNLNRSHISKDNVTPCLHEYLWSTFIVARIQLSRAFGHFCFHHALFSIISLFG